MLATKSGKKLPRDSSKLFIALACAIGLVLGRLSAGASIISFGSRASDETGAPPLVPGPMGVMLRQAVSTPPRTEVMNKLMEWFEENGGLVHRNLELRAHDPNNPGVMGFFAKGPVKPKEVLLAIPQQLFITTETALSLVISDLGKVPYVRSSSRGNQVSGRATPRLLMETLGFAHAESTLNVSATTQKTRQQDAFISAIAVFLAVHFHDTEHFFYPYFASLPRGCQMALCWSDEKLQEIFRPTKLQEIQAQRHNYVYIAEKLGLEPSDFLEKVSLVKSRYWRDPTNELSPTLVPIADMLNHAPPDQKGSLLSFNSRQMKGSILRQAALEAQAGDQVWDSYGKDKNSAVLLKEYGFILLNNPADKCEELRATFNDAYIQTHIKLPTGPCPPPTKIPEV
eukprot:gb/GEZN01008994.1/.p1 GENE.gb/GEZN01008994.1/~~gb/GEZN01008994.1/.p1  ORF type:complete len:398 (+),score=62.56 gb/GEZN01008994.1/:40-1233(+)